MKTFLLSLLLGVCSLSLFAQIPSGYYDAANGKNGYALKTALYQIVKDHTVSSYSKLWNDFKTTDKKADGTVWDMYSDIPGGTAPYTYTFGSDQCGNYSGEGSCYNREHSFPKSWFGGKISPMYTDLFHLYPTDGYVNNRRSNYPFGEVGNASWTSKNKSKVGSSSYSGYSGTVFEPLDEYKGDFARTYFYMATRYENVISSWEKNSSESDAVMNGTNNQVYEDWFLKMIMEWHEADPVSQKEIDRNNEVYKIQKNRNPFIDHPDYVCQIWGDCEPTSVSDELKSFFDGIIVTNPVQDEIKVTLPETRNVQITVYSLTGQLIKQSGKLIEKEIKMNITDLDSGVYLLHMQVGNDSKTVKIIKYN